MSPFCGSADGLDPGNIAVLATGERFSLDGEYIGLIHSDAFDAWKFVGSFPEGTILCSGGELLIALGLKDIYEKGRLYILDPETKTGEAVPNN